jgi:hypothetical protein
LIGTVFQESSVLRIRDRVFADPEGSQTKPVLVRRSQPDLSTWHPDELDTGDLKRPEIIAAKPLHALAIQPRPRDPRQPLARRLPRPGEEIL